jgi:hypothetical protein
MDAHTAGRGFGHELLKLGSPKDVLLEDQIVTPDMPRSPTLSGRKCCHLRYETTFSTLIADVATTGNSVDQNRKSLLGIMS